MKKILILTFEFPPIHGGIATYVSQLALAAHEIGHEITVVAPQFGKDFRESDKNDYPYRVIRYDSSPAFFRKWPSLIGQTRFHAKPSEYDIIHAADWPHIFALGLLNKFKPIPFTATLYGGEILAVIGSKRPKHLLVQRYFEIPRHIYAISEYTRSLIIERCPRIPRDRISVALMGVNSAMFESPSGDRNIRSEFSIPEDHRIILTLARLDPRKGHRLVLKAIRQMPESIRQKVAYLIVGGGIDQSYIDELHELADLCGTRVIFTGPAPKDQVKSLYAAASIFCMPGEPHQRKVEGFGLAYLEAAAQGVPAIAGRIGGIPEAVLHEKTGLLVEPQNEAALTGALMRLLTDESYRRALGRSAREYAGTFTWKRCVEQTYGK